MWFALLVFLTKRSQSINMCSGQMTRKTKCLNEMFGSKLDWMLQREEKRKIFTSSQKRLNCTTAGYF